MIGSTPDVPASAGSTTCSVVAVAASNSSPNDGFVINGASSMPLARPPACAIPYHTTGYGKVKGIVPGRRPYCEVLWGVSRRQPRAGRGQ